MARAIGDWVNAQSVKGASGCARCVPARAWPSVLWPSFTARTAVAQSPPHSYRRSERITHPACTMVVRTGNKSQLANISLNGSCNLNSVQQHLYSQLSQRLDAAMPDPVILELAVNGATPRSRNRHV